MIENDTAEVTGALAPVLAVLHKDHGRKEIKWYKCGAPGTPAFDKALNEVLQDIDCELLGIIYFV